MSQNNLYNENIFLFMILEPKKCLFRGKSRDLSSIITVNGIDCWFYQTKWFTSYCIYLLFVLAPNPTTTEALDQERIKKHQNWLWINVAKCQNLRLTINGEVDPSWQKNRKCLPNFCLQTLFRPIFFYCIQSWKVPALDRPPRQIHPLDKSWK